MVVSSSSARILSKKWQDKHNRIAADKRGATDWEISHYEITGTLGTIAWMKDGFKIDTQPVDPDTKQRKKAIDVRNMPERGGR